MERSKTWRRTEGEPAHAVACGLLVIFFFFNERQAYLRAKCLRETFLCLSLTRIYHHREVFWIFPLKKHDGRAYHKSSSSYEEPMKGA